MYLFMRSRLSSILCEDDEYIYNNNDSFESCGGFLKEAYNKRSHYYNVLLLVIHKRDFV